MQGWEILDKMKLSADTGEPEKVTGAHPVPPRHGGGIREGHPLLNGGVHQGKIPIHLASLRSLPPLPLSISSTRRRPRGLPWWQPPPQAGSWHLIAGLWAKLPCSCSHHGLSPLGPGYGDSPMQPGSLFLEWSLTWGQGSQDWLQARP